MTRSSLPRLWDQSIPREGEDDFWVGDIKGIPLPKNQQLLKLLFADDQVIIPNRENNLQKAAYKLNKTITEHSLNISVQKN